EFLIANGFRDFFTAQYNMSGTEAESLRLQIMRDTVSGRAWGGLRRTLRASEKDLKDMTDDQRSWYEWARDFQQHGGQTGWIDAYSSIQEVSKDFKSRMNSLRSGNFAKHKAVWLK